MTPTKMKMIDRLPDYVPAGKKRAVGREVWEIEFDGLPPLTVKIEIPSAVQRLKDERKRVLEVQKIALDTVEMAAEALANDHMG